MREEGDEVKSKDNSQDNAQDNKKQFAADIEEGKREELLDALAELYEKVQIEPTGRDVIIIEELKEKEILEIEGLCGKKLWGFRKVVKFNDVRHICDGHGQEYERLMNQKTIGTDDFIQLVDVLTFYTKIEFQPYDATKKHSEAILYYKDNRYEVVMKINYRKKELALKTMWIKR